MVINSADESDRILAITMKIGFVAGCPYPVPQGSQAFIRENALTLKKRGHEIHLIVYGHGVGQITDDFIIHRSPNLPGVQKISAGPSLKKICLDLLMVKTLKDVCKKHQLQVLFAHNYEGLLISLLAGIRPIIYHAHNVMSDELPYYFNSKGNFFGVLGNFLDTNFPKRANYIIVPHERLAGNLILKGCKKEKIRVIPPPIDIDYFPVSKIKKEALPSILYTGNLDKYQNIEFLFKVVKRVRETIPETRFVIGTFEKINIPDAEVIHIGTFDSLKKLLEEDSIMAIPRTSWSGYPIKLLNGMASAKPVVCCEGSAYGIKHGFNGLIVANNDEDSFANSLVTLMTNPRLREELGKNARETIEKYNNPEIIGKALEDLALKCI